MTVKLHSLTSEMIDIVQLRASIGLWNCCNVKRCRGSNGGCLLELSCLFIIMVLSLVLILSGDIELNPGPKTGEHCSSQDLLKLKSPDLSRAITDVIWSVTEALHAKGLVTFETKNQILTTHADGTFKKAIYLVYVLETNLGVSSDPDKYLIDICHLLIDEHHQPLTDVCNFILQQLDQPTVSQSLDDAPTKDNDETHNMPLPSTMSTNLSEPSVTFNTHVCDKNIETEGYLFKYNGNWPSTGAIKFTTPLSPLLNYFEFEIVGKGILTGMVIGLVKQNHPPKDTPGWISGIGCYVEHRGKVWKNGKYIASGPSCNTSDRMGCGIDFDTSLPLGYVYVLFTKNGIQCSEPIPVKQPSDGLYPLIGLNNERDKVRYLGHWRRHFDQIQELMVTGKLLKSHQIQSNIPSEVREYCDFMKDKYKDYQPYISDWPPQLKCEQKYFGRLTLMDRSLAQNKQWSMLRGHIDIVPEGGETITLMDLIKPNESDHSLRAVVDGPPGVGKTTLCRILLNMWATMEQIKHQYDLVLFCPLRNEKIAQANELKDLFLYKNSKVFKVVQWLEDTEGERVLIIFDGWDELSTQLKRSSLPASIIQREILDKCSVLITSRTYASSSLLNLTSHNKYVQIMGFSLNQLKMVIKGTLKEAQQSKKLIKDLKVRSDILTLCYIPLICSMVIYVYDKKGQLPTTLTELYEYFILQTIRRHIEKNNQLYSVGPEKILGLNERDLPQDVADKLKKLCKFAYIGLKENNPKITFSYDDLEHLDKSGYLGLITEYGEDGNQFLHLSIQEFLASWWIAKYEKNSQEIFQKHFDNDHFKMSLRFFAGLTHLEPNDNYQQYFNKKVDLQCNRRSSFGFDGCYRSRLYQNPEIEVNGANHFVTDELDIFLLQLLYESQSAKLCSTLARSMKNHSLCLRNSRLSLFDTLCVSYFLNNSNVIWNHLDTGVLNKQQVQLLSNSLKISSKHKKRKILEVKLESPTLETAILFQSHLFLYFQECYIMLELCRCNSFFLLIELFKLRHLKILHFFAQTHISYFHLDNSPLSFEQLTKLTQLLENSNLQELAINVGFTRDYHIGLIGLLNGLVMNKTIKSITLEVHILYSLPFEIIAELLTKNHTIQAFDLKTKHIPSLYIPVVKTPLSTLRLNGWSYSDYQTLFLPEIRGLECLILPDYSCLLLPPTSYSPNLIFQAHPRLQQLEIPLDTAEKTIELFAILKNNVILTALKIVIWCADIYKTIGDSLCDMLRLNQTIEFLQIEGRKRVMVFPTEENESDTIKESFIDKMFLFYLSNGLSHNTSLQELSVLVPLSLTNNEQTVTFFNIISNINNLKKLIVNFTLDQLSYSDCSSDEETKQIMTSLYHEHGLRYLTNMIISHSPIRLLNVTCHYINSHISQPNWIEPIEQLYQSIFLHPSLEYIAIQRTKFLKDILEEQKKTLIDKRKQQLLTPIEILFIY